ncbi:GNAT family N-acetyltransferase [Sinobaca sp. H24]|uniref:GNAT family N-acetyltransferase n=1 Tax=Sinobaca sp. H24 TaxID=2923376 RepID=UPI00207A900C|nr:GNAT family N-acetyltransferase [Sinobaca sp. H24]
MEKRTGRHYQLRLMTPDDAEDLYQIATEASNWTYMVRYLSSVKDMESIIETACSEYEQGTSFPYTVIERKTGRIRGSTRLYNYSESRRTLELGSTYFTSSLQGTGINAETKYLLLQQAFEEIHAIRVQVLTDEKNVPAQRALERLGAVKEGVLRNERQLYDGRIRNAVMYSIIAEEWPKIKMQLKWRMG